MKALKGRSSASDGWQPIEPDHTLIQALKGRHLLK